MQGSSCSSGSKKQRSRNGLPGRRWARPMDHGMCPRLQPHQDQRHNRQRDLQPLGSELLRGWLGAPPLRGGFGAQVADPCDHRQVHHSPNRSQDQHRNANRVLMKSPRRCVDAAHGCQGGESNRQPNPADDKDSGAEALQEGKQEACSAECADAIRIVEETPPHASISNRHRPIGPTHQVPRVFTKKRTGCCRTDNDILCVQSSASTDSLFHSFARPTPFAHNNAPAAHNSYVKAQKAPSVPSAQIRRPVHSALPTQEFESKIGKNKGAKKAIRRRIALSFFRSCGYVIESKRLICRATLLFR